VTQKTEISIIRNFGDRQLIALELKISSIKPGQFFIGYNPEKDDHLIPIYFALYLDEIFFMKPQNTHWEIGDQLILKGPIGSGFSDYSNFQNLLCISLGQYQGGLNPLIDHCVSLGKNVAYMLEDTNVVLPNSVEIVFPFTLAENLLWANYILIEAERDHLGQSKEILKKVVNSGIPAEILIYCPNLCSGDSLCEVCSVKTKKGWIKTCQHGTVFKLNELEF
jgi:NAD(P)H-flavin reductase